MKICLLTRTMELKRGGAGRVSSELYTHLTARGHDVRVIQGGDKSLYSYFSHTLIGVPTELRRIKADIYHAVTPMEALWIPAKKGVVTFLDLFPITDSLN